MIDKEKFDKIYKPDYSKFPKSLDNISVDDYRYLVEELSISGKLLSEYFNVKLSKMEYLRQKFSKLGVKPNKSIVNKLSNLYNYDSETPYNKEEHSKVMKNFWKTASKEKLNEISKHKKQTNLEKYGVESITQLPKFKQKRKEFYDNGGSEKLSELKKSEWGNRSLEDTNKIIEKRKNTKLEKYGDENYNNPEKRLETISNFSEDQKQQYHDNMKKAWSNKTQEDMDEIVSKRKATQIEKYGDLYTRTELYEQTKKQTNLEKYGVEYYSQTKEFSDKMKKIWSERTDEEKLLISQKVIDFYQNMSEEQKQKRSEILRKSSTQMWKDKTQEDINSIKLKMSKSGKKRWENMSEEDKLSCINKNRVTPLTMDKRLTLIDYDKFKNFLIKWNEENNEKPTPIQLNEYFGYKNGGIYEKIHQYNLESYIDLYKSNLERELREYISEIYNNKVIYNDRKILEGKELDIYIPEKNLAIEFNGCYWHSVENGTPVNYHQNKSVGCMNKNINLIHVYEDEWEEDKDRIKNIIKYYVSPENIINSEDCEIKRENGKINLVWGNITLQHLEIYNDTMVYVIDNYDIYVNGGFKKLVSENNIPDWLYIILDKGFDWGLLRGYYNGIDICPPTLQEIYVDEDLTLHIYDAGSILWKIK